MERWYLRVGIPLMEDGRWKERKEEDEEGDK